MNPPNLLTLSRMAMAPVLMALFYVGTLTSDVAALVILGAAGLTDLLDGHLARKMGIPSTFGKIVDPLSDSFVFLALFGGFVITGWMPVWVFAIFLLRETFMHGFLRPYFLIRGVALAAKWAGKIKTFLQSVVGVGVLLAIAATRDVPARPDSVTATLMKVSCWALLFVGIVSVASLQPYLAELCRLRHGEKALVEEANRAEGGRGEGASL